VGYINDYVGENHKIVGDTHGYVGEINNNVGGSYEKMGADNENMGADNENMGADNNNTNGRINNTFTCLKCNKALSSKQQLGLHASKCNGLDPKQCPICLKVFASRYGKYEHKKYVKCKPPVDTIYSTNTNTNINTNINTTNNYNTTNNITNTINIRNNFYKITQEDVQRIVDHLENKEYFKIANNNLDIGKYVIPRTMAQIYFNDDFPDMQTLKKERRNDRMVEVHVGEGRWEKRLIGDIFKMVIGRVEEYHAKYFRHLENKNKNIPLGSVRWKQIMRPVKTFGNTMLWYDGFKGDNIESIGVELNYPDDDADIEKERERRTKEMEQLVGEKVYEETLATSKRSIVCDKTYAIVIKN